MVILKLRPHHLGLIYDVVAWSGGGKSAARIKRGVIDLCRTLCYGGYPEETVYVVASMLAVFFFKDGARVEIVNGLDSICLSGCVQKQEALLKKELTPRKRKTLKSDLDDCRNEQIKGDLVLAAIFNVETGKIYSARQILETARIIFKKYRKSDWIYLYFEYSDRLKKSRVVTRKKPRD